MLTCYSLLHVLPRNRCIPIGFPWTLTRPTTADTFIRALLRKNLVLVYPITLAHLIVWAAFLISPLHATCKGLTNSRFFVVFTYYNTHLRLILIKKR
jgi:hypothetical protein